MFFHTKADDLQGPYVPPGTNIEADNIETLYLAYVRRLNTSFEVELAIGVPPKTETKGKGPATLGSVPYDGQVISTARWLAPTLLVNYKFLDDSYKLRPYIGFGVNYTRFYDRRSTPAGDAASGGPTRLSLTSSVGPAGTIGLSYNTPSRLGGVFVLLGEPCEHTPDGRYRRHHPHHAQQLRAPGPRRRSRLLFLKTPAARPISRGLEESTGPDPAPKYV